ncbi:MAG: ATPase, partial [Gammaproteobacteria bacterium]|nr:ATPase [Gammaproteobacteria bacterium]
MIERPNWVRRLQAAWDERPIVWLSGVRRVGKTTLSRMLPDARHLNCDLPSVQRSLEDPELFFDG